MIAKIMAIMEAIKGIASIFQTFAQMYETYQEKRIEKHYDRKRKVVEKVTNEIEVERQKPKGEQSDENLKELHRRLHNLTTK